MMLSTTTRAALAAVALAALTALASCAAHAPPAAIDTTATPSPVAPTGVADTGPASVHRFTETDIDGANVSLAQYAGKVLLIVNVASKCGFTPQYEGLERLYKAHAKDGFEVLGFPCDQFGNQEPGSEKEIKTFCATRYSVSFPLFAKVDVNGPKANPLYVFLRGEQKGSFRKGMAGGEALYSHLEKTQPEILGTDAVKWNFTKFLVDRHGHVVTRFESPETPEAIEGAIVAQLAAKE